jgi:cytosolic carboxypeptidase protein 6
MIRRRAWNSLTLAGLLFTLVACASIPPDCTRGDVRLTHGFSGAPAHACTRTGEAAFRLTVAPESTPINPSPWYAFAIETANPAEVRVELAYALHAHRYPPRIDRGDGVWELLPAESVSVEPEGRTATLDVTIAPGTSRIAAQEVFGLRQRAQWRAGFAASAGMDRRTIGHSVDGQPIEALSRRASDPSAPLIVILGGQHPPEVTGVLALRAFLQALFDPSSPDAILDRFEWLIVPDLNPDGIERGHWRHNLNQTDLNRDWGPFNQPETAAVRDEIEARISQGQTAFLLMDFHSTYRDVLYTPPDDFGLSPQNFSRHWIAGIDAIWPGPGIAFERGPNHNPGLPTAKTWFAETYGAPGLTVEFGDQTGRGRIAALAQSAATALRTYLENQTANQQADTP